MDLYLFHTDRPIVLTRPGLLFGAAAAAAIAAGVTAVATVTSTAVSASQKSKAADAQSQAAQQAAAEDANARYMEMNFGPMFEALNAENDMLNQMAGQGPFGMA